MDSHDTHGWAGEFPHQTSLLLNQIGTCFRGCLVLLRRQSGGKAGCASGVSIFSKMFRKVSQDPNFSAGLEKKRERESARARERESILYGTQEWPSEQQVLLWHPGKETSSFHTMGLLGGICYIQHAPPPSNCPGGHLLPQGMRNALGKGTSVPHELCHACLL